MRAETFQMPPPILWSISMFFTAKLNISQGSHLVRSGEEATEVERRSTLLVLESTKVYAQECKPAPRFLNAE
jgi:hypothetical protein